MTLTGNENVVYPEGDRYIYRASGLYNCTNVLLGARLGITPAAPPDWMQERFDEGHRYENMILERARTRGINLFGFQETVERTIGARGIIRGHIDAMGRADRGTTPTADTVDCNGHSIESSDPLYVVDAKAFAESTYEKWVKGIERGNVWDEFPYYAWQLSFYADCLGAEYIGMAIGLKDRNGAEDKLLDFRFDVFTHIPVPITRILRKVLQIESLAAKGIDGMPEVCDQPSFPCPYYHLPFHTQTKQEKLEVSEEDVHELERLAAARLRASTLAKEYKDEVERIDGEVLEIVKGAGNVKLPRSNLASSLTTYRTSRSEIDWVAVKRDFPELDIEKYKSKVESKKLTVKVNPRKVEK